MKQRNCKNCGAPLEHSYNHKCPYCNTLYDFNTPEDEVQEVRPEDIIDIKLRVCEPRFETDEIIMVFDGYYCPIPKVYEMDGIQHQVVSTYTNPKRCGFCLAINRYEIEKYGIDAIKHRIIISGIRENEIDNTLSQIIENNVVRHFARIY